MKISFAILAALCFAAASALAQAPATGTQQKAPAQHSAGTTTQAAPAQAQAPPSLAEKADPAKEAAIRHLMDITQTSKLGENISAYLTNQVRSVMSRSLSPEDLPKFMDSFNQKFAASSPSAAVTTATVAIYARTFSMEDIQGLIQFYESPLGQRVVKVLPEVSEESQKTGVQIEQDAAMNTLQSMQDDYPQLKPLLQPKTPPAGAAPGATPTPGPAPQSPTAPPK